MKIKTIEWKKGKLFLLDQTKLPLKEAYVPCTSSQDVAQAIRTMVVRGAPAIGVAAAFGMVLGLRGGKDSKTVPFQKRLERVGRDLLATRPTAVNLRWAVERMLALARKHPREGVETIAELLEEEAEKILEEDILANRSMGRQGQLLIPDGSSVLTHCNAGALATAGYGTALGVIRAAVEAGKRVHVYVDETRPLLQGARLTAWELAKERIPCTLITDNMAGALMSGGKIDLALVGADRIAANGDTANKIGTYPLAVLCRAHRIPFFVAAPFSTIDWKTKTGGAIPIEQRSPGEVTAFGGKQAAPRGIKALNPAFDVTPNRYITALITESGVVQRPFGKNLKKILSPGFRNSESFETRRRRR